MVYEFVMDLSDPVHSRYVMNEVLDELLKLYPNGFLRVKVTKVRR
jgi:hypothetical protein